MTRHETFRREYVRCGKKGCRTCPHGPYWYAYWRDEGKLRKRYVGKTMPPPQGERSERHVPSYLDRIHHRTQATLTLALLILGPGINLLDFEEAQRYYRKLALVIHPDRGGGAIEFSRINSAWAYLCSVKGW